MSPLELIPALLIACGSSGEDTQGPPEEDKPALYLDEDRDGYTEDVDCDDDDDRTYPGAREACDDRDNDCDEIVDEDPADAETWYLDADLDGFGDEESATVSCEGPEGSVLVGEDCDDSDDSVHPDAQEICGDGIDNNCQGGDRACSLEGSIELADADLTLSPEYSGGNAGCSLGAVGGQRLAVGACNLGVEGKNSIGAVYLFEGPLESGERSLAEASMRILGDQVGMSLGTSLGMGDLRGDGSLTLAVGAAGWDEKEAEHGAVLLFDARGKGELSASQAWGLRSGISGQDSLGRALQIADLNSDGVMDLLVSAPLVDSSAETGGDSGDSRDSAGSLDSAGSSDSGGAEGADNVGAVYGLMGPLSEGSSSTHGDDLLLTGEESGAGFGQVLGEPRDLDGDGLVDLLIGAASSDEGGLSGGEVLVFSGPLTGSWLSSEASQRWSGGEGERLGSSIATGDLDGDGLPEIFIGSPGQSLLRVLRWGESLEEASLRVQEEKGGSGLGSSVVFLPALEGSEPAWLVGAPEQDNGSLDRAGAAFLFGAELSGTLRPEDARAILRGSEGGGTAGASLLSLGDLGGDGGGDLLIAAPEAQSRGGQLYLLWSEL